MFVASTLSSGSSVAKVIRHYQSLFTLSTLSNHLLIYYLLSFLSIVTLKAFLLPFLPYVLFSLGVLLFPFSDYFLVNLFEDEKLFTLRRILALNTTSLLLLFTPIFLISLLSADRGLFLFGLFLGLGFSSSIRLVVYVSLIRGTTLRRLLIALYTTVLLLFSLMGSNVLVISLNLFLPMCIFIFASLLYLHLVNRLPIEIPGLSTFSLVRAYTHSWVLDAPEELDRIFERISMKRELTVDQVYVKSKGSSFTLWAPHFHFGPLKNVGSSLFPSLLKRIAYRTLGQPAIVFHTAKSHVYNLSSNHESRRVINELLGFPLPSDLSSTISRLVRISHGGATASACAFGDTVLLALSYEEMEDIPEEIAKGLREEGKKMGFEEVIVVDAHNSLSGMSEEFKQEELEELHFVGVQCLKSLREKPQGPFEAALVSSKPVDMGIDDGMGSGGVAVFMWKVFGEKYAFVVMDANNLSPGLRHRVLAELRGLQIESEVITTDTHEVTARRVVARGYVVLGETGINDSFLLSLRFTCCLAASSLKKSKIGHTKSVVSAHIFGRDGLTTLTTLTEKAFSRARAYAFIHYGLALLSSLFLLL